MNNTEDILKQLESRLTSFSGNAKTENIGTVEKNNDGVLTVSGLSKAVMGERVV
jgi:F0F1-type ATP synthase alpha subunit